MVQDIPECRGAPFQTSLQFLQVLLCFICCLQHVLSLEEGFMFQEGLYEIHFKSTPSLSLRWVSGVACTHPGMVASVLYFHWFCEKIIVTRKEFLSEWGQPPQLVWLPVEAALVYPQPPARPDLHGQFLFALLPAWQHTSPAGIKALASMWGDYC